MPTLNVLPDAVRRRWLQNVVAGSLTLGLGRRTLPGLSLTQTAVDIPRTRLRSCVFVFYYGGPSHLDSYDLKPDAPSTVRGEFQPIATSAPGIQICEHLPRMAKVMHKVALIRSMHHTNRLHDSAGTETFTGRQSPQGDREEFAPIPQHDPCHGAVLNYLRERGKFSPVLPTARPHCGVWHASLPWLFHNVVTVPCQGGGFLGSRYDPFTIAGDASRLVYRSDMLARPEGLPLARIAQRRELIEQVESSASSLSTRQTVQLQQFVNQAYGLLESKTLQATLDVTQEDVRTRERYGMTAEPKRDGDHSAALAGGRALRGQNLLMARRLVESGVPFVNVQDFRQQGQNWDSHRDNFDQHRRFLLPPTDQSLSALIEDLDDRGLLESTLVVALGEFGRTPQINGNAGRDHWPDCYSILLAGGGIRGGAVLGSSDRIGAYPETDPVTPADLAATIYWRFGLDPHQTVPDQTGRPHRLADGRPLTELF
ncbi:DUF1501 domain-containing protein [bacterium]|nr:DUF1501 domain-containing protein [bacterium]